MVSPSADTRAVQALQKVSSPFMTSVRVNLGPRSYDIAITTSDLAGLAPFARERCRGSQALVVTDVHAQPHGRLAADALNGAGLKTAMEVLPAGEPIKSLATASRLYDRLADLHADRQTIVAAVGGGVVGDVAGFSAATYNRGLPLLMIPTTLLAMVDSSVGGKVAVNHPRGKNLIGAFYQPAGVWIDTSTLKTLPDRELSSGLAEVVKYGVILDAALFAYLEANVDRIMRRDPDVIEYIIARCCRMKADVVEKDEREETGLRMALNYGHTFAHAFETAGGYGRWLHGEAVSAGIVCAARLAESRGLVSLDLCDRQERLLTRFGLPITHDAGAHEELLAVMRSDKKAVGGRMRFVLPVALGQVAVFDDVAEDDVNRVLEQCRTR
jgi:3-dehydroquinate synthase